MMPGLRLQRIGTTALRALRQRGLTAADIRKAPSNLITSPFKNRFRTMCSTSSAYSDGRPSRDGNGIPAPSEACTSGGNPSTIGVWNKPGAIVTTRTPARANSRAAGNVIATTPPFDAA